MDLRNKSWTKKAKTTLAASTIFLTVAMTGVVSNSAPAEARTNFRLCYISTEENGSMYFGRPNTGLSPQNCSDYFVKYPDGSEKRGAKDVAKLDGVDYSICENFTEWKFTDLVVDADVCNQMDYEKYDSDAVYSIEDLATISGYTLKG